jgi:integrase
MPQKLTQRVVDALAARTRPYEVRDSIVKGFLTRVESSGLKTFWFVYTFNGRRMVRYKLGTVGHVSADGARKLAKVAAGDVAKGVDPQARRKADRAQIGRDRLLNLRTFLDHRFEPWAHTQMKSAGIQLKRIRSDFADYLDKPMTYLHQVTVEALRQKWKKGGKQPRTINRDLQRVQSVLSRAVEWGVIDRHPFRGLRPMKYDKVGRVRYLSVDEEVALRAALDAREDRLRSERVRFNTWRIARGLNPLPDRIGGLLDNLKPMVLLALNTGMRRGELFSLEWRDVDFSSGIVTVRAASAKSGQTRRIPLNSEAATVLTLWHKRQGDASALVFPNAEGTRLDNIAKSWGGVMMLARLERFNFHDLRHTFASRLVQRGVDLNTVRTLLGHSEISTTLIYSHLAPDNLRAAVEKVTAA